MHRRHNASMAGRCAPNHNLRILRLGTSSAGKTRTHTPNNDRREKSPGNKKKKRRNKQKTRRKIAAGTRIPPPSHTPSMTRQTHAPANKIRRVNIAQLSLGDRTAGYLYTVVNLCALVHSGRSVGPSVGLSVGRFRNIERGLISFLRRVKIVTGIRR